ncbi:MAG: M28 family peptidase [Ignavibacteria bacterium]|jgi:hypothetical protein
MQFLASDIFEGRGTGTTGGNLAAKYIALEYSKYNLKPIGNHNTYYQYIPMHGSTVLPSSELTLFSNDEVKILHLNDDYLLYKTGQQTYTPVPLSLVFVGYGIIAPEFDYNDYQELDVEGKIVVFLSGEPKSDNPKFFDAESPTVYSHPDSKQRIAVSRGAAGSILIPVNKTTTWEQQRRDFSFEDITLAYSVSGNLSILINPEIAGQLFYNSQHTYLDVLQMHLEERLISFPLNAQVSFKGEFKQRDFLSPNIIGMIEGNDPDLKDSYEIISAHYDHLGLGIPIDGDSIYNGALDNALGVSVLLEIARTFSEMNPPLKRSVIFLALTGEEKGLLGSTYYTDHPSVPLSKTVANINIDGIAMFEDFLSMVGIGAEYSTLKDFLEQTASNMNLTIETIPSQFKQFDAFNRSDQVSFAIAGIPSILILEGPTNKHLEKDEILNSFIDYMINIYHTPSDDLNQNINYTAAVQHARVIANLCITISNSELTPQWEEGIPYINARLRSIAEGR